MSPKDLENLAARSRLAGENKTRSDAARVAVPEAEAELMRRVFDAVAPALDALSNVVRVEQHGGPGTWKDAGRGCLIAGTAPSPRAPGEAVYLMPGGEGWDLLLVQHEPDGAGGWRSTTETIAPLDLLAMFDGEAIIGHLSHLVDGELSGKRERRTADLERRARKLRAICDLLAG